MVFSRINPAQLKSQYDRVVDHIHKKRHSQLNSRNRDALFLWIPKTAGTSLASILAGANFQQFFIADDAIRQYFKNKGIVTFGHISVPELVREKFLSQEFVDRAWKFAFVRNPFDRAVSLFEYLKFKQDFPATTSFSIFCQYLSQRAFVPIGLYNHFQLNQLNPQYVWLQDAEGRMLPDFIGRFERFDQDVRIVCRELQLQSGRTQPERLNVSSRNGIDTYYTAKEVQIVQDVYERDFQMFGYDLNPYW